MNCDLTRREYQVVELLRSPAKLERTHAELAAELGVKGDTFRHYASSAYQKLGVSCRLGLLVVLVEP